MTLTLDGLDNFASIMAINIVGRLKHHAGKPITPELRTLIAQEISTEVAAVAAQIDAAPELRALAQAILEGSYTQRFWVNGMTPSQITGTFTVRIGDEVLTYSEVSQIPDTFDNLIAFEPDFPEPPHSLTDHAFMGTFPQVFADLQKRERR